MHIFANVEGGSTQHDYRRWFNEALTEAKIKDYSWHCNRHAFASRLVMAGVDLRAVAELMGHSSIQMTMHCTHLAPHRNGAAVDRLASASMPGRAAAGNPENKLITKSAANRKAASLVSAEIRDKSRNNSGLKEVAP